MGVARAVFPFASVEDSPEHIPADARARLLLAACLRGRTVVDVSRLYIDADGEFVISVDRELSEEHGGQSVLFRSAEDGKMGATATAFIEIEASEEWRMTPVEGCA